MIYRVTIERTLTFEIEIEATDRNGAVDIASKIDLTKREPDRSFESVTNVSAVRASL
jgi:hypothetical protein